ncbi:MAG: glycosyl hydrolase 53 family protein, partial [Selenomonas sp.]|nr:glycosyl hydrolase 53 family protein [Selenomonas sp.]
MKNHGINWIRVRIWNNPQDGPGGGGNTTEARAIELAQRAHKIGLKVLVDFHYSDWWADPGKQVTPKAWEKHDEKQLVKDV